MSRTDCSLVAYRDTEEIVNVTIKRPNLRYLNEFLGLRCATDLLLWEVFPNCKEITESFGAFNAVRRLWQDRLADPSVSVVCVGDGNTPRTAATFAARSVWTCYSVDPRLKTPDIWAARIRRLVAVPAKIEEWPAPVFPGPVVVVAVHSHGPLDVVERFGPELVVAVPCCVAQEYQGRPPDRSYADWGITSPKRWVNVWINGK